MRLQDCIEAPEHKAGLDQYGATLSVQLQHVAQIFRAIEYQRVVHRLPALTRSRAARQDGDAFFAGDRHRRDDVADRARHEDADRLHLIDRSVSRIPAAIRAAEQDLPLGFSPQPDGERAVRFRQPSHATLAACVAGRTISGSPLRNDRAASTPPLLRGTPARVRPISTPLSAPISIRSLRPPTWPMRKTRPLSLLKPAPSDMSKRRKMISRSRSASCPSGITTAVSTLEYSRGSWQRISRPQAFTAARVAEAWRACRAKTFSSPSSCNMAIASRSPNRRLVAGV